jgi:hypothetical protein
LAGYSETPLARKLGIDTGHTVCLVDAPDAFDGELAPLPAGVTMLRGRRGTRPVDVALLFANNRAALLRHFRPLRQRLVSNGGLWVCWPKKASGRQTDLGEGFVREHGLASGLVDNKICAVNDTWSALRFVIRKEDR